MPAAKTSSKTKKTPKAAYNLEEMRRLLPEAEEDVKAMMEYDRTGILPARLKITTLRYPVPLSATELRKTRREIKLSQSEMADLIFVPKKTYQDWEKGLYKSAEPATLLLQLLQKFPEVKRMLDKLWSNAV